MNFFSNIAFSIARKQTKTFLQRSGRQAYYEKALNSVLDNNLRKSLERYGYSKDAGSCSFSTSFVEDIIQKLNLCKDEKIKTKAVETIVSAGDKSKKELRKAIHQADGLLDSENVAEGLYSTLYTQSPKYTSASLYSHLCKEKYQRELKYGFVERADLLLTDLVLGYSEPRAFFERKNFNFIKQHMLEQNGVESVNTKVAAGIKDIWQGNSRFASLREYIQYHPEDIETSKYLWENKFLPYIKSLKMEGNVDETDEIIKLMKEINARFGTMVFIDEKEPQITKKTLEFIKEEFSMWQNAGKGQEKYPLLLNITEFNKTFTQTADAFCNYEKTAIYIRKYLMNALRHEMGHLNVNRKSPPPMDFKYWMADEYRKAGLDDKIINYASYAECEEPFAVYLEGDMAKYSERMHNYMGKNKQYSFVRELPVHRFI